MTNSCKLGPTTAAGIKIIMLEITARPHGLSFDENSRKKSLHKEDNTNRQEKVCVKLGLDLGLD